MSKIVSIGTAVPEWKHQQQDILAFMQNVYAVSEVERRKLRFLYHQGGIDTRYSVIPDYSLPANQWQFFNASENLEPVASLEKRMEWYARHASPLSFRAISDCLQHGKGKNVTHLITVSCTGMSAPGLDIELLNMLGLPASTFRTSVNFMGCYAAIHALKMADAFCKSDRRANVLIVCTELCTLHFQNDYTVDNITSSLLFSDGSAAVLVSGDDAMGGLTIDHFYSQVETKGHQAMAWELSSKGFLMTLSSYVADLIEANFEQLADNALTDAGIERTGITHWCIHPGGKKILESVHKSLGFTNGQLLPSYEVLRQFGNMSSATILFVLKEIFQSMNMERKNRIFGAAFGPGLTTETFILST